MTTKNSIITNKLFEEYDSNKKLESYIDRTWPILKKQLNKLLEYNIPEDILKSKNIILSTFHNHKVNLFDTVLDELSFYSYKDYAKSKIMHNLCLIETYIYLKDSLESNIKNTFFDWEISIWLNSNVLDSESLFLQPDITIFKGNSIYCIEMDMSTETYKTLQEKENNYKLYLDIYKPESLTIFFSAHSERNKKIKEYQIFSGLNIEFIDFDKILFKNIISL